MFPQQCWYVAANAEDIKCSEPFAATVAGINVVLYRDQNDNIVALDDKCCHRLAPLSRGRIEGSDIRCMYHGIKFGVDGKCIEVPGQKIVPKSFCIKTHSAVERNEWVWLWIGNSAHADESLIPNTCAQSIKTHNVRKGSLEYAANFELLNDNLLDLSHLAFVHPTTLGMTTDGAFAKTTPNIEFLERGVRISRWTPDTPSFEDPSLKLDFFSIYDYLLPGVFLLEVVACPRGTATKFDFEKPKGSEALMIISHMQAVTPTDDNHLRYFYSIGLPKDIPEDPLDAQFSLAGKAFLEDKAVIEAQHRNIQNNPEDKLRFTAHDKAIRYFRGLVNEATAS